MSWFITPTKTKFVKGFMRVEPLIEYYFSNEINTKLPHVVHFRKASNKVCEQLTHPFVVSGDSRILMSYETSLPLLYHNGILSEWRKKLLNFFMYNKIKVPSGEFSDSRFLAILTHYLGIDLLPNIEGKFVIFNHKSKINVFGDFVKDTGVLFSNSSYKSSIRGLGGGEVALNIKRPNIHDLWND